MESVALLVIAKQPRAGRVKTRLTPPFSPTEAAALAAAALRDTLEVVAGTPAARRVLVFEGDARGWSFPGFEVSPQRGDGLGERLQAAFAEVSGPALLIGMDTPQLTRPRLQAAAKALEQPDVDAVLGPTPDGGYWCVGLRGPVAGAFAGVPMSRSDTCLRQRQRFAALGLRVALTGSLRDVDTVADARAVASAAPATRFAHALAAIS